MKLHELRLMLLFEQEPSLRASIRELSHRAGLNYRSAYETATRFASEGVLAVERFGQVKACSLNMASEGAVDSLTEASLARWLLALGKGALAEGLGQAKPLAQAELFTAIARRAAEETGALCLLLAWPRPSGASRKGNPLPARDSACGLIAVASNGSKEEVRRSLAAIVAGSGTVRAPQVEVVGPEAFPACMLAGDAPSTIRNSLAWGSHWLVLMGHERFWRMMGVRLA